MATKAQITRDMIINDVIKKYPKTIKIFHDYEVDSCCGGGKSIEKTATADGVDIDALLISLNTVVTE